jgi:hypothetical protein
MGVWYRAGGGGVKYTIVWHIFLVAGRVFERFLLKSAIFAKNKYLCKVYWYRTILYYSLIHTVFFLILLRESEC